MSCDFESSRPPLRSPVRGAAQGGRVEPAEPADQRPRAGPAAAVRGALGGRLLRRAGGHGHGAHALHARAQEGQAQDGQVSIIQGLPDNM